MSSKIRVDDIPVILQEAVALHGAGELGEAERKYQDVLEIQPKNPTALHLLGVIAYQCGQGEKGIELISQALALQGAFPEARSNLGLAFASIGRYEEARDAFIEALELKPQFPDAHSNLGLVFQELGQLESALESHSSAADQQPQSALYHYNLGICLAELGRHRDAESSFDRAVKLQNHYPDAYYNLGLACYHQGRYENSAAAYERAVEQKPDHAAATCNLGTTLFEMGRFTEAASRYRRALEVDESYIEAWHNLGLADAALGKPEAAVRHYLKTIELQPDHAQAYRNLGNAYRELGRVEQAFNCYHRSIEISPHFADAHHNLGNLYYDTGMASEAELSYSQAIAFQPDHASAHRSRTRVVKHMGYNEQIIAMERLLDGPGLTEDQRMHLGFGLGKAMEDIGRYDRAFEYYRSANEVKRKQYQYSADRDKARFARLKGVYSTELFDQYQGGGYTDSTPVFIVGMPRSGTSLVEQILASHAEIYGAGELMLMADTAEKYFKSNNQSSYPETLSNTRSDTLKACGEAYARQLRSRSETATRITDKMPGNFEFIGLIKLILPNARIVHCCRGAEDTCLSIYKNYFSSRGHYYAYDLAELGSYYRGYHGLMAHWRRLFPDFIYDIHYEEIVADHEQQARALIAYCGLDWDPACLDFHSTARSVKTASAAQVRQPIYDSSVAAWKHYESKIGPLLDALQD